MNLYIADENKKPIKTLTVKNGDKNLKEMFNDGDGLFLQLLAANTVGGLLTVDIAVTSTKANGLMSEAVTGGGSGIGIVGGSATVTPETSIKTPINPYLKLGEKYSETVDKGKTYGFSFSITVCVKDAKSAKELGLTELPAIISIPDKNLPEKARIVSLKQLSQTEINNKKAFLKGVGAQSAFEHWVEVGLNQNADTLLNLKGNNKEKCVPLTYSFGDNINPEVMESYRSSKEFYFILDPHKQISKDNSNKVQYCKDAKCNIVSRSLVDASLLGPAPTQIPLAGGGGSGPAIAGGPITPLTPSPVPIGYKIETIAGTGIAGFSGDGGPAKGAQFNKPSGIAVDSSSNIIYFADKSNNRIRKIDLKTSQISTFAGTGGTTSVISDIYGPTDIAVDSSGNVYVTDASTRFRKIDKATGQVTLTFNEGITLAGMAIDSSGNIYLGQVDTKKIIKIDALTGKASLFTTLSVSPLALGIDKSNNLYVASGYFGSSILKVGPDGKESLFAGAAGVPGFSGDGGSSASAKLQNPLGVYVDSSGNVYVADSFNHKIRRIGTDGIITTIAGSGVGGGFADGDPATSGKLSAPIGIVGDPSGNIYIADTGNQRIRKISPIYPTSTPIPTSTPTPISQTCGGFGGIKCPSGYQCIYSSGSTTPTYPDAMGSCKLATCTDSDGDDRGLIKGTTVFGGTTYKDYCRDGFVWEYTCNTPAIMGQGGFNCPTGTACKDGACIRPT